MKNQVLTVLTLCYPMYVMVCYEGMHFCLAGDQFRFLLFNWFYFCGVDSKLQDVECILQPSWWSLLK